MLSFHPNNATWRDVIRMNINPWLTVDPPTHLAKDLLPLLSHSSLVLGLQRHIMHSTTPYYSIFFSLLGPDFHPIWPGPSMSYLSRKVCKRQPYKGKPELLQTSPMKLVKRSWKLLQVYKSEEDKDHWSPTWLKTSHRAVCKGLIGHFNQTPCIP